MKIASPRNEQLVAPLSHVIPQENIRNTFKNSLFWRT